ncbi:MAG TPA: hypothetical protein VL361_07780 [Candidatus Limnocylindrales bacterium]|nr:hypothetical protein [Candidatus Limnocylindrales bacterium]
MQRNIPKNPHPGQRRWSNLVASVGLVSLAAGWTLTASAGDRFYNFDPPNGDPAASGFVRFGSQVDGSWHTNNGASGSDTDGFLEITDAVNGQTLGVLFPLDYFTNADQSIVALPLKGFFIEADVRIGNATGNNGRPADGFSISYAKSSGQALANPADDPVVYWGKQGQFRGWAGGDSDDQAREPSSFNFGTGAGVLDPLPCDSGTAENGTKTGVSVQFDTWSGNRILNENGLADADNVGWRVHFNGKMLQRILAQPPSGPINSQDGANDLNGLNVCPALSTTTWEQPVDDPACRLAVCNDTNSIQTGPYNVASSGSVSNLCWTHFSIELTTNTPHLLTVKFKGRTLIENFALTNFQPFVGQLVMGGRTGGANENRDIDNVHIITYPSVQAVFGGISSSSFYINDFTVLLQNLGPAKVTSIDVLTLDGVDIKAAAGTTITLGDPNNTIKYVPPTAFPGGSGHVIAITYTDAIGNQNSATVGFATTQWATLPASASVPAASIDTGAQNQGFRVAIHQTDQGEPNRQYWADEQLEGLHGTNWLDFSTLGNVVNGEVVWQDVVDFGNAPPQTGQFGPDRDWANFNVPATGFDNDNNLAAAFTAYLYFPQPGLYVMGGNSDDGLRVTYAANSHDLLGATVPGLSADVGRGIGADQNVGALLVTNAGYYGFRYLFYNGGGGCNVEWYLKATPAGVTNVLVNDVLNNPTTAIKAYQVSSAAPPYFSFAEPPLNDDQVLPRATLKWGISDASTTVKSSSVVLKINGTTMSPTITSSGGVTTIVQPPPAANWLNGTNSVEITFQDSANANYDYKYNFVVPTFSQVTLTTDLLSAPGSGNTSGFRLRGFQTPNTNILNGWRNIVQMANQALNGFMGANVADLSSFTHNGEYWETGVINYSQNNAGALTQNGDFRDTSGFPDKVFPGLGTWNAPSGVNKGDNDAMEIRAYVEFPASGLYLMGVNSDDGFRVTEGESTSSKSMLSIAAPAGIAGDVAAMMTQNGLDGSAFGGPLPRPAITAQAVLCDPPWPTAVPNNAAALNGKIAILQRDANGGTAAHSVWAQNAGAIAEIIVFADTEGDANLPGIWGGTSATTNPVITTTYHDGTNIMAHATKDANSPVQLTIGDDSHLELGIANYGKGSSDIIFGVNVPQPGVYPLRLIWENAGGDQNCEWFVIDAASGDRTLINATNSPVKAWINRTFVPPINPKLTFGKSGNSWVLTYEGTLYSSSTANGTYTPVTGASSPYTIPSTTTVQFYRAHSP